MGIIYVFVSRNEAVTILAGFHFNIFRGDSPRPEGIIRARQLCWTWFKRSLNEFRKLNNEEVCVSSRARKHIKQYKQGGNCFSWHCPVSGKMSPKSIISLLYCILTWGCWWGWGGCRGGWAPAAPCWITRTQCLPCLIFWQKVLHLARNFCSFNTCFDNFAKFVERAGQSFNYPGARSGSSAVSWWHRWRPPPSWCGYIWNNTRSKI